MFERPGRASDRIPAPYANEQAARAYPTAALSARPVADRQGARRSTRGFPDLHLRHLHAVPGDRAGLYLLAADRLRGAAGRASRCRTASTTTPISSPARRSRCRRRSPTAQVTYAQNQDENPSQRRAGDHRSVFARTSRAFLMWAAEPHLVDAQEHGLHGDGLPRSSSPASSTTPRRRSGPTCPH